MSLLRGADMFVCRIPNTLYSTGKVGFNVPSAKDHHKEKNISHHCYYGHCNHHHQQQQHSKTHTASLPLSRSTSLPPSSSSTIPSNNVHTGFSFPFSHHYPTGSFACQHHNHSTCAHNISHASTVTAKTSHPLYPGKGDTSGSTYKSRTLKTQTTTTTVVPTSHTSTNHLTYSSNINNKHHAHHGTTTTSTVSPVINNTAVMNETGIGKDFLYSRPCYDCELFLEKCMKQWGLRNVYYTTDMTIPYEYGMDKDKYATEMYRKIQERKVQAAKERRAFQKQQIEQQRLHPRGRDIRRELRLARLIPDEPSSYGGKKDHNHSLAGIVSSSSTANLSMMHSARSHPSGSDVATYSDTHSTHGTNLTVRKSKSVPRLTQTTVSVGTISSSTSVRNLHILKKKKTSIPAATTAKVRTLLHPTKETKEVYTPDDSETTMPNMTTTIVPPSLVSVPNERMEINYDENYTGSLLEKYYRPVYPVPKKVRRKGIPTATERKKKELSFSHGTTIPENNKEKKKHPYLAPVPLSMQQQRRRIRRKRYLHLASSMVSLLSTNDVDTDNDVSSVTMDNCSITNHSSVCSLLLSNDLTITTVSSVPSSPSNRSSRSVTPSTSRSTSRSSSPRSYDKLLKIIHPYDDPLSVDSPRSNTDSLSDCSGRSSPLSNVSETSVTSGSQRSTPSHVSSHVSLESTLTLSLSIPSLTMSNGSSNGSRQSRHSSPLSLTTSGKHSLLSVYRNGSESNSRCTGSPTVRSSFVITGKGKPTKSKDIRRLKSIGTIVHDRSCTVTLPLLMNHNSSVAYQTKRMKQFRTQTYVVSFTANIVGTQSVYSRTSCTRTKSNGLRVLCKFDMNVTKQDTYCIP